MKDIIVPDRLKRKLIERTEEWSALIETKDSPIDFNEGFWPTNSNYRLLSQYLYYFYKQHMDRYDPNLTTYLMSIGKKTDDGEVYMGSLQARNVQRLFANPEFKLKEPIVDLLGYFAYQHEWKKVREVLLASNGMVKPKPLRETELNTFQGQVQKMLQAQFGENWAISTNRNIKGQNGVSYYFDHYLVSDSSSINLELGVRLHTTEGLLEREFVELFVSAIEKCGLHKGILVFRSKATREALMLAKRSGIALLRLSETKTAQFISRLNPTTGMASESTSIWLIPEPGISDIPKSLMGKLFVHLIGDDTDLNEWSASVSGSALTSFIRRL